MAPATSPLPPRISRAARVARELEDSIRREERTPGERLATKQELRERYSVAAATINEAVRLLETRGVVEARPGPGGGIFVARAAVSQNIRFAHMRTVLGVGDDTDTFRDCLAVRDALDPLVCRDAARLRTAEDIAELRDILPRMERDIAVPAAYFKHNWDLHRRIAAITPNAPLRGIYLMLLESLEGMLGDSVIEEFDGPESVAIHRELVAAIEQGPGQRLEAALALHTPLRVTWVG